MSCMHAPRYRGYVLGAVSPLAIPRQGRCRTVFFWDPEHEVNHLTPATIEGFVALFGCFFFVFWVAGDAP